jgi:hypothetical protein
MPPRVPELVHVRTAPNVEVGRCGARQGDGPVLRFTMAAKTISCPGCKAAPKRGRSYFAKRAP